MRRVQDRGTVRTPAGAWPPPSGRGPLRVRAGRDRRSPRRPPPTPTQPARMRNERRDQSGIEPAVAAGRDGVGDRVGCHEPAEDPEPDPDRDRRGHRDDARARPAGRRARRRNRRPRRRRTPRAATVYRRAATTPRPAPISERDRTTMRSSSASLSLVPKRATTKSLAPGGWRSMTTWPTAATSDVAPGEQAGEELGAAERGGSGGDGAADGGASAVVVTRCSVPVPCDA